jgi:LasA protease
MIRNRLLASLPLVCLLLALFACSQGNNPVVYVTATNAAIPSGEPPLPNPFKPTPTPSGPTATPLQPTPNPTYPPTNQTVSYSVQAGDSLASIADIYGITVDQLLRLNNTIAADTVIFPGQILTLPGLPSRVTPNFKIIPDSELVNSQSASHFDVAAYIKFQPGFIRVYSEDVSGRAMSGAEIIQFFATSTSVNPRLLLALLEYRGGWITNPVPTTDQITYPMGYKDANSQGLFMQLHWATNMLNGAYYGWKYRGFNTIQIADKTQFAYSPELNPASVALQFFLSINVDRGTWDRDIQPGGFFTTYMAMFGDPFRTAIEPLIPPDLRQPEFSLPFEHGETWFLTAGPHGGWNSFSGWAAIDFAPPTPPDELLVQQGACYISPAFATAMVGGLVVRSADGAVVIDTDMDGDERTGWNIVYLHVADQDRVLAGTVVQPGSRIGHPSCQGFFLNSQATHLHIGRRYNGEWIPADCWACAPGIPAVPFVMSGWTVKGYPEQLYQGYLEKDGQIRKALQGRDNPDNQLAW